MIFLVAVLLAATFSHAHGAPKKALDCVLSAETRIDWNATGDSYSLYYFDLRGRAEAIRLLLHYAGQEFNDVRIERTKEWPELKPLMPFRQVPVLVHNCNFALSQSLSILRYLGRKFDLEPSTVEEAALADMYGEQVSDYMNTIGPWSHATFNASLAKKVDHRFKKYALPVINDLGTIFGKRLEESGSGYLIGKKLSWVDFLLATFVDQIVEYGKKDAFKEYPVLAEHHKRVLELPELQKYLASRPATKFRH